MFEVPAGVKEVALSQRIGLSRPSVRRRVRHLPHLTPLISADSLLSGIYAVLDSVCVVAQRVVSAINCHAEAQRAPCRLALG